MTEKGSSKMENKYTLRIKSCGSTMANDGYKWRKYGQKSIKNSPNPRYFLEFYCWDFSLQSNIFEILRRESSTETGD